MMKEIEISSRKLAESIANRMLYNVLNSKREHKKIDQNELDYVTLQNVREAELIGSLTCKDDLINLSKYGSNLNKCLANYANSDIKNEKFVTDCMDCRRKIQKWIHQDERVAIKDEKGY